MNSKEDSRRWVSLIHDEPTEKRKLYLGVDTETYWETSTVKGLRSIQVYGRDQFGIEYVRMFEPMSYNGPDHLIRREICAQFFDWLDSLDADADLFFFNIQFDASQFILYLCRYSGYSFNYDEAKSWTLHKGECSILESESRMYSINLRTFKGRMVHMIDVANFLPGSTLTSACRSWIGKEKVALKSKRFSKSRTEGIERKYAMEDAKLTYELSQELIRQGVIEGHRVVTIAGRTIRHFQAYMKEEYGFRFDDYFFPNMDRESIEAAKAEFEEFLRPSVRGGITMAVHTGLFENCTHIDARSMYPTQCVKPLIPIGPLLRSEPVGPSFRIVFPSGFFKLRDGKIPYLQWRTKLHTARYHWLHDYEPGEYVKDFYLDGSYCFWGEEWEVIQEAYEGFEVEIEREFWIAAAENIPLYDYIRYLYKGKQENTGSVKLYFKILLNSLYGKFLTRPDGTVVHYVEGKRVKVEETDRRTYYLPLGSWIAMGGRVQLWRAMSSIPVENVLYCDTDSIIFKGNQWPDVRIGRDLGEWGIEAENVTAWIVGPKTYQELFHDKGPAPPGLNASRCLTKCAGMPRDIADSLPFGVLQEGLQVDCFKPRRDDLTMAINIEPTTFQVSTRAQIFKSR